MSQPPPLSTESPPTEPPFRRVHPLTPVLRGGIFLLAWAGWMVNRTVQDGFDGWFALISAGVVVVAGVVVGAVSWWLTRFRISAEEIRVDSGLLVRRSRRVRIERLQSVEVQQPALARLFGMAELSLEVAGQEGGAKLAFLPLDQAYALRREVLGYRERVGGAMPAGTDLQADVAETRLFAVEQGRLAGSLCLRTGFVGTVVLAALGLVLETVTGTGIGLAVVLGAGLGVVAYWVRQYLAWGRFTVSEAGHTLRVRSGLLSLRTQSVPLGRVQGLVLVEPVLWRALGWARLDVTVAGVGAQAGDEAQQLETALVPVARRGEVLALVRRMHGFDLEAVALHVCPSRARWLDPLGQPYAAVGVDDWVVVTRRGVLTTRTDIVPRAKIQSVALRQGPLERRLGLATAQVLLPSGPVSAVAVHREAADAWWLTRELARPS